MPGQPRKQSENAHSLKSNLAKGPACVNGEQAHRQAKNRVSRQRNTILSGFSDAL
jgi:hypothetical protein